MANINQLSFVVGKKRVLLLEIRNYNRSRYIELSSSKKVVCFESNLVPNTSKIKLGFPNLICSFWHKTAERN